MDHVIYILVFPNKKAYIGQTKNFKERINCHKQRSKRPLSRIQRDNPYLYSAIKKYGWDNINKSVLHTCDSNTIDQLERDTIQSYKSNNKKFGYNLESGGTRGKKLAKSTIEKLNTFKGVPVIAYDPVTLEKIKEYLSALDAGKDVNTTPSSIGSVCRGSNYKGKRIIAAGYLWRYTTDVVPTIPYVDNTLSPVLCYDLDGKLIKEYVSLQQAQDETGIKNISPVCRKLRSSAGGFIWQYKKDIITPVYNPGNKRVKVASYNKVSGELIHVYNSIVEASKQTGANESHIAAVCNGRYGKKTARGLKWQYIN